MGELRSRRGQEEAVFGLIADEVFGLHRTPAGHPERAGRVNAMLEAIEPWEGSSRVTRIEPVEVSEELLEMVHSPALLGQLRHTSLQRYSQVDLDTHTVAESWRVARLAAGGAALLASWGAQGKLRGGLLLARPPGHHAERNRAMGFCLLNNAAIAAEAALAEAAINRVAIVDFDVHHGNGTQHIFYQRSDVLYLSTHQFPHYPGTGAWNESGSGEGTGYTVNFPLPAGCGDDFYVPLFRDLAIPILQRFHPDLILVSAGFDAHQLDPLAQMKVTENGFGELVRQLNQAAASLCESRVVYLLEGGYHLEALKNSIGRTLETCLEGSPNPWDRPDSPGFADYRARAGRQYSAFWRLS